MAALGIALLLGLGLFMLARGEPEASRRRDSDREPAFASAAGAPTASPAVVRRVPSVPGGLTGRVRAASGKAVPQATVCASCAFPDCGMPGPARVHCATSAADGSYAIADLPAGRYRVGANARGYLPGRATGGGVVDVGGAGAAGIDIALERGGALLEGRVLDIFGGAIAGALIATVPGSQTAAMITEVHSDADGCFELQLAPGPARLRVSAAGYAWIHAEVGVPTRSAELILTPASAISGVVLRAGDGRPIAGVEVRATKHIAAVLTAGDAIATSDPEGRFRIDGLSDGDYDLTARAAGWFGRARSKVSVAVAAAAGPVRIDVRPARSLRGVVTLERDGGPCPGGSVLLGALEPAPATDERRAAAAAAAIESAGAVTFAGVPPGAYRVVVLCEGEAPHDAYAPLHVGAEDLVGLRWAVPSSGRIVGRVVDAGGRAQPGRVVSAVPLAAAHDPDAADPVSAISDREGGFALVGLSPDHYRVQVEGDSDATTSVELPERGAAPSVLLRAAAAAAVGVTLSNTTQLFARTGRVYARGPGGEVTALAAGPGRYELSDLTPGSYEVLVSDGRNRTLAQPVVAPAGGRVEIRFSLPRGGAQLRGRVLDRGGAPVSDAWVRVAPSQDAVAAAGIGTSVLSEPDGSFVIDDLVSGETYDVDARHDAEGSASAMAVALDAPLLLTLRE